MSVKLSRTQPCSQGSLLPALSSLRWAGRREPWERSCEEPLKWGDFLA